ncbi:MAG TPA: E3 binding domain-containing protein, partial [Rubrobacter sp.]|nr:E3 binding domain-containing protein [Rubrobacter sp.]
SGNPVERRVKIERSAEPEPVQPRPAARRKPTPEPTEEPSTEAPVETSEETKEVEATDEEGKVHATDAAERKAGELGVDLSTVEGTGQGGRITVGDVEKAAKGNG